MPLVSLQILFAGLLLAAVALPRRRDRLIAALGLPGYALGAAALSIGGGLVPGPSFLQINAGLLWLGVLPPLGCALAALRRPGRVSRLQGVLALGLVAGVLVGLAPLFRDAGLRGALYGGMLALALAVVGGLLGLLRFDEALGWLDRRVLAPAVGPAGPWDGPARLWGGLALVSGAAVLLAQDLRWMLGAAVVLGLASQAFLWRRRLAPGLPGPALGAVALAALWWLMGTLAGPGGLAAGGMDAPFSAAAEVGLIPLIAVAAWFLGGVWPLHGLVGRGPLALAAGVAAARLTAPMPLGMAHWQPALIPLVVIGLCFGAAVPRRGVMLVGWGFLGVWSGPGLAVWALLGGAAVEPWLARVPTRWGGDVIGRLFWVGMGMAAWPVLATALRVEVVYTVMGLGAVTAALWLDGKAADRTGR